MRALSHWTINAVSMAFPEPGPPLLHLSVESDDPNMPSDVVEEPLTDEEWHDILSPLVTNAAQRVVERKRAEQRVRLQEEAWRYIARQVEHGSHEAVLLMQRRKQIEGR